MKATDSTIDTDNNEPIIMSMSAPSTFSFLRPRSRNPNSFDEDGVSGLAAVDTPPAPIKMSMITPPEEPMHCSRHYGCSMPPTALAPSASPHFAMFHSSYRSPPKKQRTSWSDSQETSPSDRSCDMSEGVAFTSYKSIASSPFANKSPCFQEHASFTPLYDNSVTSSPFTPRCGLMQKLMIRSPDKSASSSPTPDTTANTTVHTLGTLPDVPTFSFSPSLPRAQAEKDCISCSSSAYAELKYGTPMPTPDRTSCSNASPFRQVNSGQITSIGHKRGSSFNTFPPRGDGTPRGMNTTKQTSQPQQDNFPSYNYSPSPRLVPLTVLSRNGSPVMNSPAPLSLNGVVMPSPLMKSLDTVSKDDEDELSAFKFKSEAQLMDSRSLPVIRLSPRKRGSQVDAGLASLMLDSSETEDLPLAPRGLFHVFMTCPDSKGAGEMDLLSGFESHAASNVVEQPAHFLTDDSTNVQNSSDANDSEEEDEVIELTHGPLLLPSFLDCQDTPCSGQMSWAGSDGDVSTKKALLTPRLKKRGPVIPLHSITCDPCGSSKGQDAPRQPSFLPRPLPVAQMKSRSLFNSVSDPIQRIIQADAIVEASRYNEPLTDDESDIEASDAFLLCLPQPKSSMCYGNNEQPPQTNFHDGFKSPFELSGELTGNHSFSSSRDSHPSFSSPVAFSSISDDITLTKRGGVKPRGMSESTYSTHCSFSDESGSNFAYAKHHPSRSSSCGLKRTGLEQSVSSMLSSMNSLCGLDIVHESIQSKPEEKETVSFLMSSESSEFFRREPSSSYLKSLRSEQSLNSLGLSVDSCTSVSRDLFTPPITTSRNSRQMLSPPPLRSRNTNFVNTSRGSS